MRPKPKVTPWPVALWPVDIIIVLPLTVAFPASGSRIPYFYIEERERHPVLADLYKAVRDFLLSLHATKNGGIFDRGEEMIGGFFCSVDTMGRDHYNVVLNKGAVAQLGERLNGIQEVRGSIPLSSTKGNQWAHRHREAHFCSF